MQRLLNEKNLLVAVILFALFIFTPSARSYAFGNDLGEHCWTGEISGMLVRHQVTQLGAFYNLNGTVSLDTTIPEPAYGTAFLDKGANKIKMGFTAVRPDRNDFLTINMVLTPGTLNGSIFVIFKTGGPMIDNVTHIPCP